MSVMTKESESPLLKPAEAAEFLKISTETLRRWANQGRVTRYGTGKYARYRRDELEQYGKDQA